MSLEEYEKALLHENEEHDLRDHNEDLLNNLLHFIKRNKQLLHLDLTSTNLTEYMIW